MDAIEFINARLKMTKECLISCDDCPLSSLNNEKRVPCGELKNKYPDIYVAIVEKWAKEHPVKTRLTEFTKLSPNFISDSDGYPAYCVSLYGNPDQYKKCADNGCTECKHRFWDEPIEESEKDD